MQKGSYKQIQIDKPVYMLHNGKSHYIGLKVNHCPVDASLTVKINDKNITLNSKQAKCCFGFYEIDHG